MDKDLIRRRFARAAETYLSEASVQRDIAARTMRLLRGYTPASAHQRVLEVGCGTGAFTMQYLDGYAPDRLWLNDLCPEVERCYDGIRPRPDFIAGDAEIVALPGGLTMVVSCSTFQWFNSQERFFKRCVPLLDDGGWLVFTTFGKSNMHEVSSATGQSLPYRSMDELREALQEDYEVLHCSESIETMLFDTPLDALRHLRRTGVTGTGGQAWTRGDLKTFCARYDGGRRTSDGRVTLTYHPIYFVTRKKQEQ
ncbi:MAG TPA: malonyl-ACP O-methyltransferase BioC [Candidatus Avibacteroides faecavium]|nr:malonyl-ACP O-methyltransferase BioC [Candidatus Avibacteroides faecavium]